MLDTHLLDFIYHTEGWPFQGGLLEQRSFGPVPGGCGLFLHLVLSVITSQSQLREQQELAHFGKAIICCVVVCVGVEIQLVMWSDISYHLTHPQTHTHTCTVIGRCEQLSHSAEHLSQHNRIILHLNGPAAVCMCGCVRLFMCMAITTLIYPGCDPGLCSICLFET